ncbi:uncharacterized protein LOC111716847 [Eurytemora carolleeae]|uniref:uncharacterized protein LOC111716847 n=1 Tax=Eurytemora carolleeae TaxID=1294199 RepID=UPI000C774559|nr:uncharacterized protein LOC111716847 [Eurytemora carolleeae]|eukprot:XP_023348120.1 uncharacterized protein LOC111716847 [Eurytemora affinis]
MAGLHVACRFNIVSAVSDMLRHPGILVNEKTILGSTPLMVAVKYASKQAVEHLIRDKRVDLDTVDNRNRRLEETIGAALHSPSASETAHIHEIIQDERRFRSEGEGRRNSLEEEGLAIDGTHRTRVFGKLKELLEELRELHKTELDKLELRQEEEGRQLITRMDEQIQQLITHQEQERMMLMERLMLEKEEYGTRQEEEMCRLLKKQEEESQFLARTRPDADLCSSGSPRPQSTRRPSLQGMSDKMSQGGGGSVCSGSPWEFSTTDEGYLTSKETELPEMIHSAWKELECPICMEVMAPPSRIWQCKMGHVICESCKDRVSLENGAQPPCPTCKTAPFIGRNLALERVARSLFTSKQ